MINKISVHRIVHILLVLLLIFLSFIPRSAEVLSGNYLFAFDQGRDYLAVKSIVEDKKPTLIGSEIGAGSAGFQNIFHGPFHYYFLAIPFVLLKGDPYGGIVLTFTYGMATIILGFVLVRKIFGVYAGLAAAFLISISPPLISASRFVWNTHGATVFILLSFYFLFKSIQNKQSKLRDSFLAAFFAGFSYNFQLAIAVSLCASIIIFSIFVNKQKRFMHITTLFLGFIFAFLPMILFEVRHGFRAIDGLFTYIFIKDKEIVTAKFIEANLKDHFGVFIYNFFDTFQPILLIQNNYFLIVFFLLCIYFITREPKKDKRQFLYFLLLLPVVSFFVLSFIKGGIYNYYLTHLYFVYILSFIYILYISFKNRMRIIAFGFFVLLALMVLRAAIENPNIFIYDYKDYGGDAKIKGRLDAVDYIYKDAGGKQFGLLVFSPPIYTYPYDYLIWWHGKRKYGYIPNQEKKGTFYLLIEVDGSKPWSYKGWLETVIKTGTILETKELPSGFIIQKRYEEENKI